MRCASAALAATTTWWIPPTIRFFKGYLSGYGNAEKAVEETYGVCGFFGGRLAQC